MKHSRFLLRHPVFTSEELANHLSKLGDVSARTQETLLAYYQKAGRIVRVRRGLYAVIPAGADKHSYPIDPFLVAARMTADSIVSHHTALEFHGRAYSVQEYFTYSASRPREPLTFRSQVFRGTKFPRALVRAAKTNAGVLFTERAGLEMRVTGLERTLVDVLDRPHLAGSWEEIWRSLESVEFFDLDKVVEYALLLENATTAAKVGLYLERHRESLMVEDRHLKPLRDRRPRQPQYMDRTKRGSGRLVLEWNLVVPGELLDRAWDEVP